MLDAVLASYRRQLYRWDERNGIENTERGAREIAFGVASSDSFRVKKKPQGMLQLLVRWHDHAQAHAILRDLQFAPERTAPMLSQTLQAVLERGDDTFLDALLGHADQAGLTQTECKPAHLVQQIIVLKLYMPDRVQKRDLRAKGDAFGLLRELKRHVRSTIHKASRKEISQSGFANSVWWNCISKLMSSLVDG